MNGGFSQQARMLLASAQALTAEAQALNQRETERRTRMNAALAEAEMMAAASKGYSA